MSEEQIYINLEFTPNPNTLKFVANRTLLPSGVANFTDKSKADKAPIAQKVFAVGGVEEVMVGTNFVTITKAADGNWDTIADEVPNILEHHLLSGEANFSEDFEMAKPSESKELNETEKKIVGILETDIRPAVAMDGGDIRFDRYEDGIVYLELQGSCSQCPSSTMTLKMGVETRLKEVVPEIKEVVAL